MARAVKLLICSDIHYASDAEKARRDYELRAISSKWQRMVVRFYRNYIWLRDPFAHNELLERVLHPAEEPDLAISNGDYSCDSAFIGVADPAARESARLCLGKLRDRYDGKFRAIYGDHELGKVSLCGGRGGLRLESLRVAQAELCLEPFWTERIGRYVLIGMTSTLAAMPVYVGEALPEERGQWTERAREHVSRIEAAFAQLSGEDRVLLFCHDPTALPYLWELDVVRERVGQIERTIIGHLHSKLILQQSQVLCLLPRIAFLGTAIKRISSGLSRARTWRHFKPLLCPSLAGIELFKRGGYYTAEIDPGAEHPASFRLQSFAR